MQGLFCSIASDVLRWSMNASASGFMKGKRCSRGFTLTELITVLAVVGVLSTIGFQVYGHFIDKARNTRAVAEIRMLDKEIMDFWNTNDRLPDTLAEIGRIGIADPWDNPYQYINFETTPKAGKKKRTKKDKGSPLNSDYDLFSMGKEGMSAPPITDNSSRDDIIRTGDGTYAGLASQY